MFEYISGVIKEKKPTHVVVEAAGVGYFISIPLSSFSHLPEVGGAAVVYVHFHVREDAQLLYGFATPRERELFRILIAISGVGPRVALTVLSGIGIEVFCDAIVQGNLAALTKISGVGKKTAERLVVELKEKVSHMTSVDGQTQRSVAVSSDIAEDALSALLALGYKKQDAAKAINTVCARNAQASVEEVIREVLSSIK